MATQLTSDSNLDFRLIPLHESGEIAADELPSLDDLPIIDLSSDQPLPEVPDDANLAPLPTPSAAPEEAVGRASGAIWLEGDVLMCACPDCRAPMSIRLWLMIADCWKCGTSIELTEEQEREAKRLLKDREKAKRRAQKRSAPAVAGSTVSRPTNRANAVPTGTQTRVKPLGTPAGQPQRESGKPVGRPAPPAGQPSASAANGVIPENE